MLSEKAVLALNEYEAAMKSSGDGPQHSTVLYVTHEACNCNQKQEALGVPTASDFGWPTDVTQNDQLGIGLPDYDWEGKNA
ncbi:hypothetical protein [Aeoliella sp.]|uniref:hypothetical protein n=1 Tax=Aeoliella sp. TaxID=2795800 RepID=UPI003CCBA252